MSWLVAKEWRELLSSRAFWLMLAAVGPLVGASFISAVTVYGELSGIGGTSSGVGEAFSPLVGIWSPTFSACELAAAFLFPFVAIRLVAGDRQSGALKIEAQHPLPAAARVGAKALVLMVGWLAVTAAPLAAVALWASYGGAVFAPELAAMLMGHLLNAGVTVALAATAAAWTEHPSTAAIVTLSVTVGTWLINFAAAVNGGWWEVAARYTPTAMVAEFQRGLVRADVTLVALVLIAMGLAIAAVWLRIGDRVSLRLVRSAAAVALAVPAIAMAMQVKNSWDASEGRRNSFGRAEELALSEIEEPLRITAHLAPEDPRRSDLEQRALRKLRRAIPGVDVTYVSRTSTGLFEQTADQYGEIWYDLGGRREVSRVTTAEGVLETVFAVARVTPPGELESDVFRGYPLAARPVGAGVVFYGVWPAIVAGCAFHFSRRPS